MASPADSFDLQEATIPDVHRAMAAGRITTEGLVNRYLARIDAFDPELNAILTVNEGARDRARRLDARFDESGRAGVLHGIPVLLKDNHDTQDMPTTAGSKALSDSRPTRDATVVQRLRAAGAVVIGKANLQELSYGVDTISSLGGATRNAYDLDRRPAGSSGGTAAAIAANLGMIGTGTDTCSSVRSPAAFNNLVGLRPTRGLLSRTGIVPLSTTQDTVGPITRTVGDAARMLDVMAGYDPADPVTARGARRIPQGGYPSYLDEDGLVGARIGVARQFFGLRDADSGSESVAARVTEVIETAIDDMAREGATIVDPVDVPDLQVLERARVIQYEFARDVGRYLSELGADVPHESLADLYETGLIAPSVQSRLEASGALAVDVESLDSNVEYLHRLRLRRRLRDRTLAVLEEQDLDAILYPASRIPPVEIPDHQPFAEMNCELAANTGLPAIVVPAGFTAGGLPVGVELLGGSFAEPRLLELAHSFERATEHRRPPERFGALDRERIDSGRG